MTTAEIIAYYANLLILQYRQKPHAYATIQALVKPVIMDQLPTQVQDAFDIDTAVGVQLDTLGKYAGVTRYANGAAGPITLVDDDFRKLIKLAIITNASGSSLSDIQALLQLYFAGEIYIFDYANMRISYLVSSTIGSQDLAQAFIADGLLPKPMGVEMGVVFAPVINKFFGFRDYINAGYFNEPFNTYALYHTDWPWLSYYDGFIIKYNMETEGGDLVLLETGAFLYM